MLVVKHTAAPLQQIALSLQLHLVRRIFVVSTGIATHTQRYARSINPIRATVVKHRVGKRHHHAPRHSGAVSNTHTRTPLWCRHKVTRRQGAVRSSDRQHRNVKRRQHGHRVGSRLRASSHNGQGSSPHSHQAHKLFEMPHHILSRCSKLFYTISRCHFHIESTFSRYICSLRPRSHSPLCSLTRRKHLHPDNALSM